MRHSWVAKENYENRYQTLSIGKAVGILDKQSDEASARLVVDNLKHDVVLCTLLTADTLKIKVFSFGLLQALSHVGTTQRQRFLACI